MFANKAKLSIFSNPKANIGLPYPDSLKTVLSMDAANQTYTEIAKWPGYSVTDIHSLHGISSVVGVDKIWYKDESTRFGLGSFKALGGAYAVFVQLMNTIKKVSGETATLETILSGKYADLLSNIVVSCATDGNHGRSVAWGAQLFGCKCKIYVHQKVSEGRKTAMEEYGAEVIRINGNYDNSVKRAASDSQEYGYIIVSDTSYKGYMEIPKFVALGYTVMLKEVVAQLNGDVPTHVFLQGGVGGLASAVCAYFWQQWGTKRPQIIIVEPEAANCLQESARNDEPITILGNLDTIMAGLSCGEVSLLAWQILSVGCDHFMTIDEDSIAPCMRLLAAGTFGDPKIIAGESAVPGLAAAMGAAVNNDISSKLNLNTQSRILVIGTEGATDPDLYNAIIEN